MIHSFNTDVAKECGLLAATIFYHIGFWCDYNEKNNQNFHDGKFWTYNSKKAFAEQFYYASERQVRTALQALRDAGMIEVGTYNRSPYDRTLWYSVTDKGMQYNDWGRKKQDGPDTDSQPIGHTGPIDRTQEANRSDPEVQPIPDINTYSKQTDTKPVISTKDSGASPTPRTPRTPKVTKNHYGEYNHVLLTDVERDRLFNDYGEADTLSAIKLLDEYIEETGKKYKNHNLTMRRWVFDALKERKGKGKPKSNQTTDFDWDGLAEALE